LDAASARPRRPAETPARAEAAFAAQAFSGSNFVPVNPPASPKPPVSDRAAAIERNLLARQLSGTRRSAANR
jgi:hypothetical protein